MAQRRVVETVSDLSGAVVEDKGGRGVKFSYRGGEYVIDLTRDELEEFERLLDPYITNGARVPGSRRARPKS